MREDKSVTTPTQIRALRLSLKLSPDAFARKFGYVGKQSGSNTVYRWETGKRKPSAPVMMLMEMLKKRKGRGPKETYKRNETSPNPIINKTSAAQR